MRYLIVDGEIFERQKYRFVYDTKYKTFVVVQQKLFNREKPIWETIKLAPENFYVYFPGFAKKLRESDTIPNWR